jgi:NAD(P)-dependent dehydrogenase (short-subunit alcohol dehydrogenase family)
MLGTEGSAWDIAAPTVFLLSAAAAWITGIVLPVDAGLGSITRDMGVPNNA